MKTKREKKYSFNVRKEAGNQKREKTAHTSAVCVACIILMWLRYLRVTYNLSVTGEYFDHDDFVYILLVSNKKKNSGLRPHHHARTHMARLLGRAEHIVFHRFQLSCNTSNKHISRLIAKKG